MGNGPDSFYPNWIDQQTGKSLNEYDSWFGAGIQRHNKIHLHPSVKRQGAIVRTWWVINFVQYTWLTIFGRICRYSHNKGKGNLTADKVSTWSQTYVLICVGVAAANFGAALWNKNSGVFFAIAAILGGYRAYEIIFAQSYYILQAQPTRLTSFTRTLLFHLLFICEISMHATVVVRHVTGVSVGRALSFGFQCLTLQADFFNPSFIHDELTKHQWDWLVRLVYFGSYLIGIVILLGTLPLVVGAAAKSWDER